MKYPEGFRKKKIILYYEYRDAQGQMLFVIGRTEDKEFPIFHMAPNRHWVFSAPAVNVPYRLPELLAAGEDDVVFIVEGEKDVETLRAQGFTATTNRGGANASKAFLKWFNYFKGRRIVIIPDNDPAGEKHAFAVHEILAPVAGSAVIVRLPGVKEKGDVTDWLTKDGGTVEALLALVDQAEMTEPAEPHVNGTAVLETYPPGDAWEPPQDQAEEPIEVGKDWKGFPVGALPFEIAEYALHVARVLNCDPGYTVLPCLVVMGGAIGNSRLCRLTPEWFEPSVFWGCLVADNSTMKSQAGVKAREPVDNLADDFADRFEHDMQSFDAEWERAKNTFRSKLPDTADEPAGPAPKKPTERRVAVDDITVEKLAEVLYDNPKGIILLRDELAGWFGSFTRYKQGGIGGTDMPFWLEAFRAECRTVDRKGGNRPSIRVKRAAVSVYGSIQPETIGEIFNKHFFSSGFAARILFAMPPRSKKVFVKEAIPLPVREAYRATFNALYHLDGEKTFDRRHPPTFVDFSEAGMEAWEAFYTDWSQRQFLSLGEIGSCLAKLEAYCARFAMMFALCDFVNGRTPHEQIQADHVQRAAMVVEWFLLEAARVYKMIGTPTAKLDEERTLAYIARHNGAVTPRQLVMANSARWENCESARALLDGFVTRGLGFWEISKPGPHGGRSKSVFKLITQHY